MNVWIVISGARWENMPIHGVYATKNKAVEVAESFFDDEMKKRDGWKKDEETEEFIRYEDNYDNLIIVAKHEVKK